MLCVKPGESKLAQQLSEYFFAVESFHFNLWEKFMRRNLSQLTQLQFYENPSQVTVNVLMAV